MLREEVIAAASPYATPEKAVALWQEIEACGHEAGRHYHTLEHFEHLLQVLTPHRSNFSDWPVVVFAIAYHDAVYMQPIFKSEWFREHYEHTAKSNLQEELATR